MNVTVEANVSDVTAAAAANASTSEVESAAAGYDSMRNLERIVSITGIMCTLSRSFGSVNGRALCSSNELWGMDVWYARHGKNAAKKQFASGARVT